MPFVPANRGFTLVEALIVVAIMAIMVTIFIPKYQLYLMRARNSNAIADLKNLKTGFETYKNDRDAYPAYISFE